MKFANPDGKLALGALTVVALLSLFILFNFDGTGAEADSFHHYLIAHFAFDYSWLYFDHWGKPMYTFLSSPFAQFGIFGSKTFNLLCSLLSFWLVYRIANALKLEFAHWVIFFIFLIPLNFQVNFSAFTEPLFALMLSAGIWMSVKNKITTSVLIISLLPMVRSEGLIILGVFSIYLIYKREFKKLPLLLAGQLLFGFLAWLSLGKSPLWIFNEIPYAEMSSPYGSGELFHFAEKLYYICGLPLLVLFLIGLISSLIQFKRQSAEWNILILGSFIAFFFFHSIAWKLGWFNSMGLKRVFGAITPIMGIIMLFGLNTVLAFIDYSQLKKWIGVSSILIAGGFLFTSGPGAIDWQHEMNLSPSQKLADQVGAYVLKEEIEFERLIYADRFLQNSLQNDPYDYHRFQALNRQALDELIIGDLIIWDSWHAPTDFKIQLESLDSLPGLVRIKEFIAVHENYRINYVIFKKAS